MGGAAIADGGLSPPSFHLRYGWCARATLEAALPVAPALERLASRLAARPSVPADLQDEERRAQLGHTRPWIALRTRSRALWRALTWCLAPRALRPPPASVWAAAQVDAAEEHRALLAWGEALAAALAELWAARGSPHGALAEALAGLAATDFPALLLWHQPTLARRTFEATDAGVQVRAAAAGTDRRAVQAAHACLGYALGGLARFAPGRPWAGAGFAREVPGAAGQVRLEAERFTVELDLAWAVARWPALAAHPLAPGVRPWDWLRAAAAGQPAAACLAELAEAAEAVALQARNFAAVDAFLAKAATRLALAPEAAPWWVTRTLVAEVPVGRAVGQAARRAWRQAWQRRRAAGWLDRTPPGRVRPPWPMVAADTCAVAAEEPFEQVHRLPARPPPYLGPACPPGMAGVFAADGLGLRWLAVEPSPRRTADRPAVGLPERPAFCAPTSTLRLAPPPGLVDHRLVRLADREWPLATVPPGAEVAWPSTLMSAETWPLLARELASPRYAEAPDLLPRLVAEQRPAPSWGHLDGAAQTWWIEAAQVADLVAGAPSAAALAAFYQLELAPALGAPAWVEALVDRRRVAWPTRALAAWSWLLHRLRVTQDGVALWGPQDSVGPALIRDPQGRAVPGQVVVLGA